MIVIVQNANHLLSKQKVPSSCNEGNRCDIAAPRGTEAELIACRLAPYEEQTSLQRWASMNLSKEDQ